MARKRFGIFPKVVDEREYPAERAAACGLRRSQMSLFNAAEHEARIRAAQARVREHEEAEAAKAAKGGG